MKHGSASIFFALKSTACALLLSGCASKALRPHAAWPSIPQPPSLTTPLPLTPYSRTARERLQTWQNTLDGHASDVRTLMRAWPANHPSDIDQP